MGLVVSHTKRLPASIEVITAAKNTPYTDLMRVSCEYVAGQSQGKK